MSLARHWISVTTLDGESVLKAQKPVPYLHSKQREENEAGSAVQGRVRLICLDMVC